MTTPSHHEGLATVSRPGCTCPECVACCKRQPGPLAPGDLERIAAHLGESPIAARRHFIPSRGAFVLDRATGNVFNVPTITPARKEDGSCIFLDEHDRCRIHPVAPAGCAWFDKCGTDLQEENRRAFELIQLQNTVQYQALRRLVAKAQGEERNP